MGFELPRVSDVVCEVIDRVIEGLKRTVVGGCRLENLSRSYRQNLFDFRSGCQVSHQTSKNLHFFFTEGYTLTWTISP